MAIHTVLQLLLLLAWRASGFGGPRSKHGIRLRQFPSANCPTKCGDQPIEFPFGIGPGCFRHPAFALICNKTTNPHRLFLMDGHTEVVNGGIQASLKSISVSVSYTISTSPAHDVYNATWKAPGRNFFFRSTPYMSFKSCDFDTYLIESPNVNPEIPICTSCDRPSSDTVYWKTCRNPYASLYASTLRFMFVRREKAKVQQRQNAEVLVFTGFVDWSIDDQPSCAAASLHKATFACVSNHSSCSYTIRSLGYSCECDYRYKGNPYVLNGCSRDYGYNPSARQNATCSQYCGKIKVPFPFGLEHSCSARMEFTLNCSDTSSSKLVTTVLYQMPISYININEGYLDTGETYSDSAGPDPFYMDYRYSRTVKWVVAILTCQEARQNIPTYACVSPNSKCLEFNTTGGDSAGYRCKCKDGYYGNPYITGPDGCHDINECEELGKCQGICHNTNGSYSCDKCPGGTEYDTVRMKCIQSRRHTIFIGVAIGLSVGFGILLLGLGAMLLIRKWRRDVQKQLRRKYFTKNRGLLLQQLISSNEDASERTKIFSLEELEQATNNFDHTRILGRGGHGMVYKGILSDQRVVAIKRSKVIEQGEIDQFINEVAILSQVNHRNIVKLYGCCLETEVPLLVYDFVPNGSLFEVLHSGSSNNYSLSWDDCLRIAAEAAGALFYLHAAASVSVFHRDVKSSNILLDANYTAKVADFGASRLVDIDQTHISTNVQGTFGYLDPEYCHTGQLNEKSDVYSFGVVLLELLLRRKPVFATETGSAQNLCNYFLEEMQKRPVKEIVASQVHEEATEEEITNVASLAEMCLQLRGEGRPTMKTVEMSLQYLHMNRLKAFRITPENHRGMQSGNTTDPISANSQRCYSLEQEFMSSASIPR